MIRAAKIALGIVLFGALAFNAVFYYLNLPHPSYLVWAILYGTTAILLFVNGFPSPAVVPDKLLAASLCWLLVSFAIAGQSDSAQFAYMVSMFILAPYVAGRMLGEHLRLSDFRMLYALAAIMLALMGLEFLRDPSIFTNVDRLHVFSSDASPELVDGTHFYIASLFGSIFVVALATWAAPKTANGAGTFASNKVHIAFAAVSLIVLVLWGSRGGLLAVVVMCIVLLVRKLKISPLAGLAFLAALFALGVTAYQFLPEERRTLIDEIPNGLATFMNSNTCFIESDSVLAHLTMWSEAIRLFLNSPTFGIGATNFGLQWCSSRIEFASPHSSVSQVLVEFGLVGGGLWLAFYFSVFRFYRKNIVGLTADAAVLARTLFFLWVYFFLSFQTAGNIYEDAQLYLLTALLASYMTRRRTADETTTDRIVEGPVPAS